MALKFDEKINQLGESEANAERIRNIEKCFGNDTNNRLLEPGRVLVGEGVLSKMCRKGPKLRYFFLFNDLLCYGTSVIDKKKYINQHLIPLNEVKIEDIPDSDDPNAKLKNGWSILSSKKSFCVYASTPKEKTEWMAHIKNCVSKLSNGQLKKNSINDIAPQWIPDKNADTCMRCHKTKFNVAVRRHHCRKCGFVVCGSCSMNKFLLKSQSLEPVRVCDVCYSSLTLESDVTHTDTSGESDNENDNSKSNQQPQFYAD